VEEVPKLLVHVSILKWVGEATMVMVKLALQANKKTCPAYILLLVCIAIFKLLADGT
jgi:hypothetical protein